MNKHLIKPVRPGRPKGSTTYEELPAQIFGQILRQIRRDKGVSQEELAHLAGLDRNHIGKIERGKHMPTLGIILRVAKALNVPAAYLVAKAEGVLSKI